MKARIQQAGQSAIELEGDSIVLVDDFDQPVMVAYRLETGSMFITFAGKKDFEEALRRVGYYGRLPGVTIHRI